jgi:hypothetical protein
MVLVRRGTSPKDVIHEPVGQLHARSLGRDAGWFTTQRRRLSGILTRWLG